MLALKLPPFFPCRVGEGKRAAISKQICVLQKRVRSYIVLALDGNNSLISLSFHYLKNFIVTYQKNGSVDDNVIEENILNM